ncbi:MAG: hypothetical protein AAGD25_15000 [Cyanobacteria bacterium P01_F01_bin.150]
MARDGVKGAIAFFVGRIRGGDRPLVYLGLGERGDRVFSEPLHEEV